MAAVLPTKKMSANAMLLDRAGICVSALCLIQCLLLPVVVVAAPMLSVPFVDAEVFHLILLGLIVPVSAMAFYLGYRAHANRTMVLLGGAGVAIVFVTAVVGHDHLGSLASALWTSLGGVLLISAHTLNLRYRRRICLSPCS